MEVSSTMSRFMSSRSTNLMSSSSGKNNKNFPLKRKGSSSIYLRTHSQTEKRRRDKMNSFIYKLALLVPSCSTKSRKLDKLSVLSMAVQHIKMLRDSAADRHTEVNHKPAFISDEELRHLLQRAADGFLFVVDCDRGKILFVSESVHKILNYSQNDLIGQSLFDYLHPKDVIKVQEQLSSAATVQRVKTTDAKSCALVKTDINTSSLRLCSGVRRSFFCRMKYNTNTEDEDLSSSCSKTNTDRRDFCTIHSTGYLKSCPPTEVEPDENKEQDNDGCNSSCLVAVGRVHPHAVSQPVHSHISIKPVEFVSRHAIDGKFVFVDQRGTAILAYLPQELLGTSFYKYLHEDDVAHLAECHREVLQMRGKINTNCYKLKIKDGSFITLRSCWFSFLNPWTKKVDYIVSTNTVVTTSGNISSYHQPAASAHAATSALMPGEGKSGLQTGPGSPGGAQTDAGKIGHMTAEELLKIQSSEEQYDEEQEKKRDKRAQNYSKREAPAPGQAEEDVFETQES